MISFLAKKIWKNKWMMLCLLIGNILLVGIVSATPMYVNATKRRILYQGLRRYQIENAANAAVMELRFTFNNLQVAARIPAYLETRDYFAHDIAEEMGVPTLMSLRIDTMSGWHLSPYPPRDIMPRSRAMHLTGIDDLAGNVHMIHGRLPSGEMAEGNTIEAIISEAAMQRQNILFGERLQVRNVSGHPGGVLYVNIVGVYEMAEGSDMYWSAVNLNHLNSVIVSEELVRSQFTPYYSVEYRITSSWIHVLDFSAMSAADAPHYLYTLASFEERFLSERNEWVFIENFSGTISRYADSADRLAVTLWVLQVPIYILLAFLFTWSAARYFNWSRTRYL